MKKRKVNILLNIATLCLCVCAIAFGVYSAKTASLNVSGTIGFQAHNVKAAISAQIRGDAVNGTTASVDGTPRADYADVGSSVNITGSTTPSLALSKFYFSDLGESGTPEDIYLKISVTNNSDFAIKAYFEAPSITGVTVSLGEGSSSYVKLDTNSNKTGDIVLKLSLNANSSGDYDNLTTENNINLTMHLDKYEDYYVKEITESVYNGSAFEDVTTNRLCTQLGHGTKEDNGAEFELLEWYAFAVKGEGSSYTRPSFVPESNVSITPQNTTEKWYSLYKVDMTNVDYKGHTFWFIQQYTVGGGYMKDSKYNYATGKMFNADYSQTTANTYANGTTYQSDIYKYLNGNTENSCDTRKSTYQLDTGIEKDLYYTSTLKTSTRTVNETDTTKNGSTSIDVNNNFTSTFWLLNYTELGLAYNQSLGQSDYKSIVKSFSIGKKNGVNAGDTVYGANWWLRSPFADSSDGAHCVYNDGYFSYSLVNFDIVGVRAAFQIQI